MLFLMSDKGQPNPLPGGGGPCSRDAFPNTGDLWVMSEEEGEESRILQNRLSDFCFNQIKGKDRDRPNQTHKLKERQNKLGGQCKSLKSTSKLLDVGTYVGSDFGSYVGSDHFGHLGISF